MGTYRFVGLLLICVASSGVVYMLNVGWAVKMVRLLYCMFGAMVCLVILLSVVLNECRWCGYDFKGATAEEVQLVEASTKRSTRAKV